MKILFRLLVFFLTMPVIELALLMQMDHWIGFWWTVLIILVTGVMGSYLAKREGMSAWSRLQKRLGEGGLPGKALLDGVIILIAGALLITPGVITDLIGFIGLIPLTRGWVRKLVMKRLKKAMQEGRIESSFGAFGGAWTSPGDTGGNSWPDANPSDETAAPEVGGSPATQGPAPEAPAPEAPAPPEQSNGGTRKPEERRAARGEAPALDAGDEAEGRS